MLRFIGTDDETTMKRNTREAYLHMIRADVKACTIYLNRAERYIAEGNYTAAVNTMKHYSTYARIISNDLRVIAQTY